MARRDAQLTPLLALTLLVSSPAQQDLQGIVRHARHAQAEFEQTRRWNLPHEYASGRCDERIGRFCYWHGDGSDEHPPPEPRPIGLARSRLVGVLDSAARLLPADGWIVGQLVRYLVEDGRAQDALAAARACRAASWWCAALAGFALHAAPDFAAADSAYRVALDSMPADVETIARVEPIYETVPGWQKKLSEVRRLADLPAAARAYVDRLQDLAGAPIRYVSVGTRRDQIIEV